MRALVALLATTALTLAGCSAEPGEEAGESPSASSPDASGSPTAQPSTGQPSTGQPSEQPSEQPGPRRPTVVRTVASGLQVPWGIAFLPNGTALVSERDTTRILAVRDGKVREVGRIEQAAPQGEAGLLGLAVSPSYDEDRLVYAYVSTAEDNRVIRMRYDGRRLGPAEPVLTGIPNAFIHDGGRLLFDDEGHLFVSTGDAGEPESAQDPSSLGGKILRITPGGEPAKGNPRSGSPIWTTGHRNVQGLAFDERGRLWATEFGQNTWDELNRIRRGDNYGWPMVEGRGQQSEYRNPSATWATSEASPSGLAFANGSLWAGALRGERLWEIPVTADGAGEPRDWFVGNYGRIRTVVVAPNGNLWITTSNRDGRGEPARQDDRILEVAIPSS